MEGLSIGPGPSGYVYDHDVLAAAMLHGITRCWANELQ